jgi:hypothetical protein
MCAASGRRRRRHLAPNADSRFASFLTADILERRTLLAVITPFTPRFTTNATGDVAIFDSTVMTAPASDPSAANAQNGVGSKINNNDFNMAFRRRPGFHDVRDSREGGTACHPIGGSDCRRATIGHFPVARSGLQHAAHFAVLCPGSLKGDSFSRRSKTACC